ncbi:xanthine dehydrogenase molybdenum-binding subunit/molybdenum cofactor cytidylyltransferase [Tumebacillus sp. BK434]|uniref:NTP transferase domain-containing protein n=1 Tax=Tumebacillus sp. BK434 TaxID=2512169 RepID=UPI00104E4D09|nr:NTP transferase domain-containing protein [Tumebacillus sp. BK434]TCP55733.1 xanthine dehydrogenase molybdenum-binding subunit/molybdenum cofactor cytidylyltransferase [Tumebacillus sp. BK434]
MKSGGVVGIYLSAGSGRRMGGDTNKIALPVGERHLGSFALAAALRSTLDHIFVVTRADDDLNWVDDALRQGAWSAKWTQAVCADADQGQAESLRCGLRAAMAVEARGAMVLLADQPLVPVGLIDRLHSAWLESWPEQPGKPKVVAASFQGIVRPPVLFAAAVFPELLKLQGDTGARELLRSRPSHLALRTVDVADAACFFDVDTPDDLSRLLRLHLHLHLEMGREAGSQ